MSSKLFARVCVMFSIFTILGCRTYNMYEYDTATVDMFEGELYVSLEGRYSEDYVKDGKKQTDYGFPYALQFLYSVPYDYDLGGMSILDIEMTGEESNKRYMLPDVESFDVTDLRQFYPDSEDKTLLAGAGGITSDRYEYENFVLSAKVIIFDSDGIAREKQISVVLKTNFRKSRRSDRIDEELSV